jgi:hypothetical protein
MREVLHDGGLEDLLINQNWHVGVVGFGDAASVNDSHDWALESFDEPIKIPKKRRNKSSLDYYK